MKIFKNNIFHDKRIEHISFKLNIPEQVVEETIDIMYDYIKLKLESIEVDESTVLTEEEFNKEFPTIHIPSLGYFKPVYQKYKHKMKHILKNGENE